MGLLSDIYSWGDSRKRELKGLLADPVGMLEKTVGQLQDSAKERGSLMQQAGWGITSPSTATPEQQRIAQQILADQGAQQAMAAATVWHGSPHKFDKFDSSKIGTGEGAQAYGHGIYTAESPQVAQQYQRDISRSQYAAGQGGDTDKIAGKPIESFYEALQRKADKMPSHLAGPEYEKLAFLEDLMQQPSFDDAVKRIDNESIIPWAQSLKSQYQPAGQLYKIDLPDEHIAKMLDWDKPLSQQHPDVQKVATKLAGKKMEDLAKSQAAYMPDIKPLDTLTGEEFHRYLSNNADFLGVQPGALMSGRPGWANSILADKIKQQGIPGIRYLDGGSRGTGQGTSNFVVFPGNEGLLKILERNGQALK